MSDSSKDAVADRLKRAREEAGYRSAREAAQNFGWTYTTYQKHEKGERGLLKDAAQKYGRAFGVKPEWLLFGKNGDYAAPKISPTITVPVAATASAGTWREPATHMDEEVIAIPISPIYPQGLQYAVRVEGESMNRVVRSGAYVACVKMEGYPGGLEAAAEANGGQGAIVHVERHRGDLVETTLKRLKVGKNGLELWPDSDHPRHKEMIPLGGDGVFVIGIAIGKYEPL